VTNNEVKTAIHLLGQVDPDELYDNALAAMLLYDTVPWTDVQKVTMPVHELPGTKMLIPVGAHSKMMVSYRPDGKPLSDEGDYLLRVAACDNPECDPRQHYPAHQMVLAFATPIGYSAPGVNNCGQFHAALIYRIGEWLDSQGVQWMWASEMDQGTHDGYDGVNDLDGQFKEYQQRLAYEAAMAALGPAVPLNSLPGLMIFANQVASAKAAEEEEEEDDDWEDPYADYVDDDE